MTEASREALWNISVQWPMWVLATIGILILCYGIYVHIKRLRVGQTANRANNWWKRTVDFISLAIIEGGLHRKFFGVEKPLRTRELYPGSMHFFIFWGFIILFLATIAGIWEAYIQGNFYLVFSLVVDIFGILAIIGVLMAIIRRYIWKPKRLDNKWEDLVALLIILIILVSGFVVEGLRIAATELPTHPDWAVWSPGGWVFAKAFYGASQSTLLGWHVGLCGSTFSFPFSCSLTSPWSIRDYFIFSGTRLIYFSGSWEVKAL
jgi:nitrate reductase gamma subunit